MAQKGILKLLEEGVVLGDGSYVTTLERRGYVLAGSWTPEAVLEHPDAVRMLHKDFIRAGADVIQAFTFYAQDGKLELSEQSKEYTGDKVNQAACDIANDVAKEMNVIVCGGLSPTPVFLSGRNKKACLEVFRSQCEVFVKNNVDFLLAEFFGNVEEAMIAIEAMCETGKVAACTLRMGPTGDYDNISPGECAVRMAKAGAKLVGVNCHFDPETCLETMALMKKGLEEAGLLDQVYLICQPVGFYCADRKFDKMGYASLPEAPLAIEHRRITRFEARKFGREAYKLGVRYIGGCCGFGPYHMREIAEELSKERGRVPPGHDKFCNHGDTLHTCGYKTGHYWASRYGEEYWTNVHKQLPYGS